MIASILASVPDTLAEANDVLQYAVLQSLASQVHSINMPIKHLLICTFEIITTTTPTISLTIQ